MGSCLSSSEEPERKERLVPPPLVIKQEDDTQQLESIAQVEKEKLQSYVRCQLYDDPYPPECSYCGQPGSDKSDMVICGSPTISYELFQKLMVRGWWRTGNVFFRPQNETICCPSFAIRLHVDDYQLSKAHKKVLNRWKDFIINGDPRWDNRNSETQRDTGALEEPTPLVTDSNQITSLLPEPSTGSDVTHSNQEISPNEKVVKTTKVVRKGVGPDPAKPPCRKAKERRAKKAAQRKQNPAKTFTNKQENERIQGRESMSLLEIIEQHKQEMDSANAKHKLEIKLISKDDPEMKNSIEEFFELYNNFQDAVHPGKSKFKTTGDLQWGFIDSPLESCMSAPQTDSQSRPLGTYHMRYYLDGELIMISLLDILPEYLVSIYFMYNPHIRFLQPGIYTCIHEIALIQKIKIHHPELKYYNLGFYNDFSPKINYKRQFKPTEILCPITNTYVLLERVIPLLKKNRFCRFADENVPTRSVVKEDDLKDLIILQYGNQAGYMYYSQLPRLTKNTMKPVLRRYSNAIGVDIMNEMLLSQ